MTAKDRIRRALRRRATARRIMMQPESFRCRLNRMLVAFPVHIATYK